MLLAYAAQKRFELNVGRIAFRVADFFRHFLYRVEQTLCEHTAQKQAKEQHQNGERQNSRQSGDEYRRYIVCFLGKADNAAVIETPVKMRFIFRFIRLHTPHFAPS